MSAPQPRPYVVRWLDRDGGEHEEHVLAYDILEASISATVAVTARGDEMERFIAIEPDLEALRADTDEDARRGLEWARSVGKAVPEQ